MSTQMRNWIVVFMLFLLPGIIGRMIVLTQNQIRQSQMDAFRESSRQEKDEFLKMFEAWNKLSPEEKSVTPWGTDPYGGPEIRKKLKRNQEERLIAELPELLADASCPSELGDILYGPGWRSKVEDHRKKIEQLEILGVASILLMIAGGAVFLLGIFRWIGGKIFRKKSKSEKAEAVEIKPTETTEKKEKAAEPLTAKKYRQSEPKGLAEKESNPLVPDKNTNAPADRLKDEKASAEQGSSAEVPEEKKRDFNTLHQNKKTLSDHALSSATGLLIEEPLQGEEDPISSLMTPKPVAHELSELTEQVSAIREYAAEQQSQMKKLQDGYDWVLIKRFCLRIIRCIDNIEDRIRMQGENEQQKTSLQDIRDELIFALESSGVESYEPETQRDYKGLEKYAEAIKDRQENDNPERSGKIAAVVRPGYQYILNDDEVKIVRCAQVKLYA